MVGLLVPGFLVGFLVVGFLVRGFLVGFLVGFLDGARIILIGLAVFGLVVGENVEHRSAIGTFGLLVQDARKQPPLPENEGKG